MKVLLLNLLLFSLISFSSLAQNNYSVKGTVVDTTTSVKLVNASVSVIRAKDSILLKFTRTAENGTFAFDKLPKGKMFLLFTYPGYADYVEHFNVDSSKTSLDFGRIKLILKANLLNDVIIKGKAVAIKIKGDTTEFNAAAYKIQPNDKVEDLLKQLQGVQVDKDGKITAQGSKVNKVLVDGEEFFGDDPTLVTKNIRADMVDKVQLYDKKSDQATFTGIDDDEKAKTINIKLKEDKKNGYFGKIDAGGATDDYYQLQGMVNVFKGKQKFAAYGTLANTGKTGLGWGDSEKYGSSSMQMVDGGFYIEGGDNGLDSYNGQYNNEGIPVARTGGAHYENKWNSDKESINANYKIGSLTVDGTKNTLTQNNQPNGLINSNSNEDFHNYMFRQKLDATYNIKLDTTANLKVNADGMLKNSDNSSMYLTESRRGDGSLLNTSERSLTNEVNDKTWNAGLFLTKKLKKKGRTLSLSLSERITQSEAKGFLKSDNEFYSSTGTLDSSLIVDQYKTSVVKSNLFNSKLSYTEPLTTKLSLVLSYGFALNNSTSDRKSFNNTGNGQYDDLDRTFSNNYKLNQTSNQGEAIFNFIDKKSTLNFGTKVTNVLFKQENLFDNSTFNRTFINWNPQANYRYKFSQQKSFGLRYGGYNQQPTIEQIQPILVNTDPLNTRLGNPNLKPSFNHNFSVNYNSYKMLSGQSIYGYISYNLTTNPIVSNTSTDSAGKSTFLYVNLANKRASSIYGYLSADRKINFIDLNVGLSGRIQSNNSFNYVNDQLNESKSMTYSGSMNISKYKEKKYSAQISGGPTYTTNESSLQQSINDNGWGATGSAYFNVYLPAKFEIGSDANYEFRGATKSFNKDFNKMIVNATVSRKFLKSEALKFSLSVNDLLKKNVGFSRSAYGNLITQQNYTTVRRYFMATVTWDFNKMGGAAPKK